MELSVYACGEYINSIMTIRYHRVDVEFHRTYPGTWTFAIVTVYIKLFPSAFVEINLVYIMSCCLVTC